MNFWQELNELKKVFLSWICIWLGLAVFFFGFGFEEGRLSPSLNSISAYFLETAKQDLLPAEVQLIVLNPLNAFLSLVIISLLSAFIVSFPFFLYQLIRYLSPALYQKEKKAMFKVLVPSVFLFIAGCFFAYFLLIPLTFATLYSFVAAIGVEEFFYLTQFVSMVLGLMIVVGIMFLLPIFMSLLTRFGIVNSRFWQENWRSAIFIFLVFSAIITPDGTGITMIILLAPLTGLYFLGMGLTRSKREVI